jgi:wobble nucleotide-excising tRNase
LRKKQVELERQRDDIKLQFAKQGIGSFEQFIKAIKLVDPKEQIKKKEEEIKRLRNIADLKSLISRTPLNSTFENFLRIVQQTLDTSAEKNIQDHIEKNWKNKNGTKNFIADGVNLLKEDGDCVFCGQNLEPVSRLVSDFKNIFGETYRKTRETITFNIPRCR